MVEQASAAAASMNDQAARLSQLTSFFKLREAYSGVPGHAEYIAPAPAGAAAARAAPLAAAGSNKPDASGRPERRSGARPWTKPASTPPAPARASAAASGSDWSEF
jgi:methyl-accepting chemotaxis protein